MIDFRGIHNGFLIAIFACMLAAPAGGAISGVYWADPGFATLASGLPGDDFSATHRIGRLDLADGGPRVIRMTGEFTAPVTLALDAEAGRLYWYDAIRGGLFRADRDGGDLTQLLPLDSDPFHLQINGNLAIDPVHRHLYWPDASIGSGDRINRLDLDGSAAPEVFLEGLAVIALAIDSAGRYAYWASDSYFDDTGRIGRIDLATRQVQTILTVDLPQGSDALLSIALDDQRGQIYWSAAGQGIMRSNLDGSDREQLGGPELFAFSMQIDQAAGVIYWTDSISLLRADLNFQSIETLLTYTGLEGELFVPQSIALDPNPIPLPGAAWAGLGMLSALAARRRWRMMRHGLRGHFNAACF